MSMKFLSGLQDLLGLYDGAAAGASTSASPPIPSTLFQQQQPGISNNGGTATQTQSKRLLTDINSPSEEDGRKIRQCSHDRKVSFCEDVVTGYCDPFTSRFSSNSLADQQDADTPPPPAVDSQGILEAYQKDCKKLRCIPMASVERQIGYLHRNGSVRQECLSLKGERVSAAQMEALEEIFRRVQFDSLDFEYCFLDDDCAVILSEILEYYDSAVKLNLSFNKQIGIRGWTALCRAIRMADSLQMINLRYTSLSDKALSSLCRSLRAMPSPALSCLHLENTNMSGKNLLVLCCSLKNNDTLKELYLGDNNLQPTDGAHLYQLIVSNTSLLMLDLRNNSLGDSGLQHLCDALRCADGKKGSLSALVLWNNKLTGNSMFSLARALKENEKIETLNIGLNKIGLEGMQLLREVLSANCHLHRFGLQSTNLNNEAVIVLAECLADCQSMVRVDIRDNPQIGSAGLLALHSAMKLNTSITLLNIDSSCIAVASEKLKAHQTEFQRYFDEIGAFCERNKKEALQRLKVRIRSEEAEGSPDGKTDDNAEGKANGKEVEEEEEEEEEEEGGGGGNTDEGKEGEESGQSRTGSERRAHSDDTAPVRFSTFDSLLSPMSAVVHGGIVDGRFTRSCSLTCDETVHDISERIQSMSASALSLDVTSNSDSTATIKKGSSTGAALNSSLSKMEWTSLPSIPQAELAMGNASVAPVVRKTRRFSVSPSSSTFDVTPRPSSVSPVPASHSPSYSPNRPLLLQPPRTLNLWTVHSISSSSLSPIPVGRSYTTETAEQIEDEVRNVINDLVNFVAYENQDDDLRSPGGAKGFGKRMGQIEEESESDEEVVQACLRGVIREVLRNEKEELRRAVESRRRKAGTPVSTPLKNILANWPTPNHDDT